MPVFDAHASFGPAPFSQQTATADAVRQTMQQSGVDEIALVSALGASSDFIAGNRLLQGALDADAGVFGYVALQSAYPEEAMEEQRRYLTHPQWIAAVLFGPNGSPVTLDNAREIVNAHRRYARPLMLPAPDADAVHAARRIAAEFPAMKFLLLGMGGDDWRVAVAAARQQVNLHLELSGSLDADKVSHAAAALSSRRLIYGSGLPHSDPNLIRALVDEARGVAALDRSRLLSQNARMLFHAQADPA